MIYAVIAGLTFIALSSIIIVAVIKKNKYFAKVVYTQSSIHQIVKHFIPKDLFDLPKISSQARKHVDKNSVKVLIMEDEAYWVHDNMFYVAQAENGSVNPESVKQVDTNNMSKRDIDRMLFILDSLKNGNSDDSGSTWNNRF
jgi:hypothetical protein